MTAGVAADFSNSAPNVCRPPVNISFTNTTTGPGIISYSWNFGDGGSSTLPNPVHSYNAPGFYTVTLVASSSAGCTDSMTKANVIVIDTIITDFIALDSVCLNSTVNFLNTSQPNPAASFWDFGDGTTSTLYSPAKIFNTAGTYAVTLTNTYNNCQDSATKTIHVIPPPVANFTAPVRFKCQPPLTVDFQDLSTGGSVAWVWDFGDGNTSSLQNPSHTYNSYGNFTVTLVATNSIGCSDTISINQFVRIMRPVITLTGLPVQGCTPFTMNFSAGVSTLDFVTSYLWDFGDGTTSTLSAPSHTYTVQGSYIVSLIITTSSGCTETLTLNNAVKVGTTPTVNFTSSANTACVDEPIQFTDLSVPADNWLWDFGNGATSTQKDPLYQYPAPGTYTVKLIARNSGCPDSLVKTDYITVRPPQSFFTYTVNCNTRTDFTFADRSDSAVTWSWDFGDGTTSALQNPTHNFPGLGAYNVSLTVTYGTCSHTYMETVRVINENPDISASTNTICKRTALSFTATNITASNIATYNWNFGDGTIVNGPQTISHTYLTSGNYTI
ncbi:MAG: PKD domain-containing protein, partial [Bacteroidia bacterium]|nr:PKD domain-containing protein [Bacteroidia bacterium]